MSSQEQEWIKQPRRDGGAGSIPASDKYVARVSFVGDMHVGKTSLRLAYTGDSYLGDKQHTVGVQQSVVTFNRQPPQERQRNIAELVLWDTWGQERYGDCDLPRNWWIRTDAVVLMYDCNSRKSFENISKVWRPAVQQRFPQCNIFVLVANTRGDSTQHQTTCKEGRQLAEEMGASFVEVCVSGRYDAPQIDTWKEELEARDKYSCRVLVDPEDATIIARMFETLLQQVLAQKLRDENLVEQQPTKKARRCVIL